MNQETEGRNKRGRRSIFGGGWLLAALPVVVLAAHCTPKGNVVAPATSASSAPSAGSTERALTEGVDEEDGDGRDTRKHKKQPGEKNEALDAPAKPKVLVGLAGGLEALGISDYATAETELQKASKDPKQKGAALLGLAMVSLDTGKLDEAISRANEASKVDKATKLEAAAVLAHAFARQGKLDDAVKACEAVKAEPEARRARLALGEILLRMGRAREATDALMTLIDDFNQKKITTASAEGMALVGRAAHLLRSKKDANESFDDAERAGNKTVELLLWRSQLFLEAYNIGRSLEMVAAALKIAPNSAAALIQMAEVKLAQALDFEAAEKLVTKALAVSPALPNAYFVRAGVLLRDMELEKADKTINEGLAIDNKDLDLLSLRATVRFLADDKSGFQAATAAVLKLNADYARMYQIIGEYADWEHRYAEIVSMMREATKIDPDDGKSFADLGMNLIRLGQEKDGVTSLQTGFSKDKFNVRAFNLLNLYERDIPQKYESVDGPTFHIRYPKNEKKVLERYMPQFLDDAWKDMQKRYGFTPTTPIGIEMYGSRENFAVRTSGLPNIGIQGVCFGETLAAISPKAEPFNWGMVVWHELGHVFAIQLSKNHVPRWFTEGLSEYETLARRPEWRREEDQELWLALKRGRIPTIEQMNRTFTHAEDVSDITMAYYASSQISVFLVERFGMPKLVSMLRAWGEGKRTPEVIRVALGISPDDLDKQFREWLSVRLSRYDKQYVANLKAMDPEKALKETKDDPKSAPKQVTLAVSAIAAGDRETAVAALEAAATIDPKNPDVRFLRARIAAGEKKPDEAQKQLEAMIAEGHDGYAVRMLLADIFEESDKKRSQKELETASNLDPTQAEPLQALVDAAKKSGDDDAELKFLRLLAMVDQHDRRVWRRLLTKLVARGEWDEAQKVGEGALYVDIHGADTHTLFAEALLHGGKTDRAIFEADSALLCEPLKVEAAARANVVLAQAWLKKGDLAKARAARDEALRQDPESKAAKDIGGI